MFRTTSAQSSLFEVTNYFPGALPDDDWSFVFKEKVLPLIDEEKFAHLYSENEGRPNVSIRTMISLLTFMGMEKLTWRAVKFLFPRRIDWMIATRTALGEAQIDHTTLFKFFQRLETDNTCREMFIEITDAFIKACGTSVKKQRTDSFFIHGWLRIVSRYGLFKETIQKFLRSLRKQKPGLYENIKGQLSQDYLEKDFDLTEKDKELAQRKVASMAKDLYKIHYAFENHKQVKHYETFKLLAKVFTQQCEVKDNVGAEPEIIIKEKPESDTICTPHNPQARYVRKGKQSVTGDKAFISETCSCENKTQFITDVEVLEATASDSGQQPEIQHRLIENDFKPEKQYGDAGFVNGKTIRSSKENGIDLEGPSAGRSQSFEAYEQKDRPLDAGDFDIRFDEHTNALWVNKCPNKQAPIEQKRSETTGKFIAHFESALCRSCSKSARCPVKIGKNVSTFTVDETAYTGAARHHKYMSDAQYRKECATRAGVEATVSELTRSHGVRRSRHRERKRTRLQLIFAALACNVKRFIRHGERYADLVPAFQ
ncbi:MAG: transposase [Pseudomonadota bacterium]